MAFIAPVALAVGSGSMAAGSILLASAAVGLATGVGAYQQTRQAGKIADAEAGIAAKAEGDAARHREIERKRYLVRAISSQQAQAGAAGVAFSEGSPARIAQLDIDQSNKDLYMDRANTSARKRAITLQGRNARTGANAQAAYSLLDTVARTGFSLSGNM